MNWYKTLKMAQIGAPVDMNATEAVYQRLLQADRSQADGASAVDDLYGQGYDPASIEGAIQEAVRRIVGPNADETMLSPAQQSVLMALRSQSQAPQPPGLPMEPIDAPMDEPIGEAWYN
tara:strand:+ start:455702 stop:456058 length:357 start_codon:yes stop_codon:yes gene_type:complete